MKLFTKLLCSFFFFIISFIGKAQWSELGGSSALAANNDIRAICTDASGNIYAAGDFINSNNNRYVAKYNGTGWSELGGSNALAANNTIYSICADASGNIYAAGNFRNGSSKCYVAKYNGTSWSELGGSNALAANSSIQSIYCDGSGNIYAAGVFTNGSSKYYVAKYNGTGWSELGGSNALAAIAYISSICGDASGNIYAAGTFINSSGNTYVAKYNGTSWSELGGSNTLAAGGTIYSICMDASGNVYAAGLFKNGSNRCYVAKYDGTSWSELGGSNALAANASILSICTDVFGNIYAGGVFTNSVSNKYIAKYDGTGWSELGGANSLAATASIYSICGNTSGNIFASGAFNNSGSKRYVAKYSILPAITSFYPTSGAPGTSVTITGTNFNTTAANNIVFFGATQATVTAATLSSLTVTVPTGATYGPVTGLNKGTNLTAMSTAYFTPTFSPNKGTITNSDIAAKVDFTVGTNPYSVAIGDLDGDGKPDLAIANYGSATVSVFRNTSNSGSITSNSFAAKVDFATGANPYSVVIGDVDGDGKPELIVSNSYNGTVSVFRNTSSSGSITSSSFATKVDFTTGVSPETVAIGDLDGDGKLDLAVANYGTNSVSVLRNTSTSGSISFAAKVDFTTGSHPSSLAIGDIDGDGKPDLAVANSGANTVSVLQNTSTSGSISFAAKVDFTTGASPTSLAIGDIDGDGKPDLAVANYGTQSVSVFRNTSSSGSITSSSFAAKVDFATGNGPISVAIGDLDGDGKLDLAVANFNVSGGTTVSIFRNTSSSGSITSSSFATKVDFATGTRPISVAIGDLDGDGKPDLAVANFSNTLSIFLNNPAYTWYSKAAGAANLQTNTNWGFNSDGSGANPTDFTNSNHIFQLANGSGGNYAIAGAWAVAGNVNVPSGATLALGANNASIGGNLSNAGSISGTGVLTLNGSAAQTISGTGTLSNLTVNNSNGVAISASSTAQTVTGILALTSGTLTTNDNLSIAPGGSITGTYANVSGNVTLQQNFIGQRGWRVLANPFNNSTTISTVASNNNITIGTTAAASGLTDSRTFSNSTNTWNNVNAATWFANTSYGLFYRGLSSEVTGSNYTGGPSALTYKVSGKLNTGNYSYGANSASNFFLAGNPFAAPVTTRSLTAGVAKPYYTYQIAQGGTQTAQRTAAGSWVAASGNSSTSVTIPVLGALMYQPSSTAPYVIGASDINTGGTNEANIFGVAKPINQLELVVNKEGNLQDKLFIRLDNNATNSAKDEVDLMKFYNDDVNFYTVNKEEDVRLAVDARKEFNTDIPLGISAGAGNYTINVANNNLENVTVYLKDKLSNTQTELTPGTNYHFEITGDAASKGESRFVLVFSSKTLSILPDNTTGGFTAKLLGNVITGSQPLQVQVQNATNAVIQIKDLNGKTIVTQNAVNGLNSISISKAALGMYIVQTTDGNKVVTDKVMKQ